MPRYELLAFPHAHIVLIDLIPSRRQSLAIPTSFQYFAEMNRLGCLVMVSVLPRAGTVAWYDGRQWAGRTRGTAAASCLVCVSPQIVAVVVYVCLPSYYKPRIRDGYVPAAV